MHVAFLTAIFIAVCFSAIHGEYSKNCLNVITMKQLISLGQEQPECFEEGECTQSLYVGSSGAEDAQTCLELCREDKNCLYFTFYGDEEECTNFGNCEVFSTDTCSNCVSGASTCEGKNKYKHYSIKHELKDLVF